MAMVIDKGIAKGDLPYIMKIGLAMLIFTFLSSNSLIKSIILFSSHTLLSLKLHATVTSYPSSIRIQILSILNCPIIDGTDATINTFFKLLPSSYYFIH